MGKGFNSTGKAKGQKGPDVLTGYCGANRVWERDRSISTILRTGGFLCPTHGEIQPQKLHSKRQKMRNLHIQRYCACNMLILLITKTPHRAGICSVLGTFPTLSCLVFAQRGYKVGFFSPILQVSPFKLRETHSPFPKAFFLLHVAAKIEAQACMTPDPGSNPLAIQKS